MNVQISDGVTEAREIQLLFDQSTEAQNRANQLLHEAASRLTALATAVVEGKTSTQSEFQDYMLVAHQVLGTSDVAKLNAIQDQLKNFQNQLILIVTATEENSVHSTFASATIPKHLYIDETLYLGIISGEQMIVDLSKASCLFPTGGRYAMSGIHPEMTLVQENLGFGTRSDLRVNCWDRELQCEDRSNRYRPVPFREHNVSETRYMELEVVLGTDAVQKWAADRGMAYQTVLASLMKTLGIGEQIDLPLAPVETRG